jgi:hypothetical protein
MPRHRGRRHSQQRPSPPPSWATWGSDPATPWSPDRPRDTGQGWGAPPQRRRSTRTRRRVRLLDILLIGPLKLIVGSYARALLRAVMPWLLPLGILAALADYLRGH